MSKLLVRPAANTRAGCVTDITPENANWQYVGFSVYRLEAGQDVSVVQAGREICLVVLSGVVGVTVGEKTFENVGRRSSVFEDVPAYCVYAPPGVTLDITAQKDAEFAVCSAPSEGGREPFLITPDQVRQEKRGEGTNTRYVNSLLAGENDADSLIIFEVYTPGGHWSSYPPHKHDQDILPIESALEETYYHKISPSQGFAFQRVYTDSRDIDETMTVHDGDTVLVPRGYHPVGAPHGYDNYYLNVMAGPSRQWIFRNDPDHEWIVKN